MLKIKTREAIIGLVIYRLMRFMLYRYLRKGRLMASKKKVGIIAAIGALIGALFFWRKKKSSNSQPEF